MEKAAPPQFEPVCFAANKRAHRAVFKGTLRGVSGNLARAAAPRVLLNQFEKIAPALGAGRLSIESYRRGGPLVVRATNAWNERLLPADVAAVFEAVEGCTSEVDVEKGGGSTYIRARKVGHAGEEPQAYVAPLAGVLHGTRQYPRCPRCGAPTSFQTFKWDTDAGEVTERETGVRVVHQAVACFNTFLRQMDEEIGEEAGQLAVEYQAQYVARRIDSGDYGSMGKDAKHRMFDYMGLIRRRCLGNPIIVNLVGDELYVRVRNPANSALLKGRALGTYRAVMRTDGRLQWQHGCGLLEMLVKPE